MAAAELEWEVKQDDLAKDAGPPKTEPVAEVVEPSPGEAAKEKPTSSVTESEEPVEQTASTPDSSNESAKPEA